MPATRRKATSPWIDDFPSTRRQTVKTGPEKPIESSATAKGFAGGVASDPAGVLPSAIETLPKKLREHEVATSTRQTAVVERGPSALPREIDPPAQIVHHESTRISAAKRQVVSRDLEESARNDSKQDVSRDETIPNESDEARNEGFVASAAVARKPRVEFSNSLPVPMVRVAAGEDPPTPQLLKRPPRITREPLRTTKPAPRTGPEAHSLIPEEQRPVPAFSTPQNTKSKAATRNAEIEGHTRTTSSVELRRASPSVQQMALPGARSHEPAKGMAGTSAFQFVTQKKQDGPRLSIGQIEVQIINENSPVPESRQRVAPGFSVDEWEQSDRRHIRVLGVP